MLEKHRRYFLKNNEVKALFAEASEKLGVDLTQILKEKADFEVVEFCKSKIFLANGRPILVKTEEIIFPTLAFNEFCALAPKVIVDNGAVPYVCKGANIMAPGIRRFEGRFGNGDFVVVADENHNKAIAVGKIAYDLEEARNIKKGLIVKNVHFVSDKVWSFIKKTTSGI